VTNELFTDTLAAALHRPAAIPVPAFALKAALGSEMAKELLLTGANVRPKKLEIAGYRFELPRLEDALAALFP
jgi:NAD dependent epimerase/dehydratase family enzyme